MSALVCLTYDDALPVHRQVVAPLLAERGLRGTFYIPAARDDLHEHLADWRRVAEMGHELGNHSCFHTCRTRAGQRVVMTYAGPLPEALSNLPGMAVSG